MYFKRTLLRGGVGGGVPSESCSRTEPSIYKLGLCVAVFSLNFTQPNLDRLIEKQLKVEPSNTMVSTSHDVEDPVHDLT